MSGLICPACKGDDTKVKDSRAYTGGIMRRRVCLSCSGRFSTLEMVAVQGPPQATRGETPLVLAEVVRLRESNRRLMERLNALTRQEPEDP